MIFLGMIKYALAAWLVLNAAMVTISGHRATKPTRNPMIRTTHLRLLVADYDAEFRFFRDILGYRPTFGKEGENYADFDCNGVCIALFKRNLMSDDLGTAH